MTKEEILAILKSWNTWDNPPFGGVIRPYYFSKIQQYLHSRHVVTIMGPRRAGKSFIMLQGAGDLIKKGVPPTDILVVNFEDSRFGDPDIKLMDQVFETYQEFIKPKGRPYLFLDEVQEITGWEKWVLTMYELGKAKIVVSGSNANLLSRELGTLLTGRHLDLNVLPLSFKEYLTFNNVKIGSSPLDIIGRDSEIRGHLRRYIEYGSFPEAVLNEIDHQDNVNLRVPTNKILLGYFEDVIHKDLIRRFNIRKTEGLKSLVRFYLSNPAAHVTFTSLQRSLKLSHDSIERFSGYLEQVYLLTFLKRFSFKVKEQEKNARKVYAVDTGICNAVGFRFSENWGKLAETVVLQELKRKQMANPLIEIFYWKDKDDREVDFVIKDGLKVNHLIQVCWDAREIKTRDREIKSLLKAMAEFKLDKALVITSEEETEEKIKGVLIKYIPLWKWLLFDEKEQKLAKLS